VPYRPSAEHSDSTSSTWNAAPAIARGGDDYADTAGKRRKENDTVHGTQPGDPDKAAQVIIDAVEAEETPAFLLLGADALHAYDAVEEAMRAEVERWRERSGSTGYTE
jgi:hypothetical protein